MLDHKLNIADRKRIIDLLYEYSGHDFRNFSSSIIHHRLDMVFTELNLKSIDDLCMNIEKFDAFRERILQILYIPSSEILRDPACWEELKNLALKKLRKQNEIRIWMPLCITGEELQSLRITLNEAGLGYKSKILVYTPTDRHKEKILSAQFSSKQLTALEKNLEIDENGIQINRYFNYGEKGFSVNTNLFEDTVNVEVASYMKAGFQSEFHLVVFRNRLLELSKTGHFDTLKHITDSLEKHGYLVIGVNELLGKTMGTKYKKVSKNEPVYKKVVY